MQPYEKHPSFLVQEQQPFNGEPRLELLRQAFITPVPLFFARNHGTIPEVDPHTYRLSITGLVQQPLSLNLDDLRSQFSPRTIAVTLQCAGNRRNELLAIAPIPGEVSWGAGAISTALWTGIPLKDVLQAAGISAAARHIDFLGLDEIDKQGQSLHFGGSIPIRKATSSEGLLAYEMNGEPLAPEHGFPLRVVIPGYIGARSVKWLSEIHVQAEPSTNYYYAHAYQLFPPAILQETADWTSGIRLGEMAVNSVICSPKEGERVYGNTVQVQGYALAGGGRMIVRVDISTDGGETWVSAHLGPENEPWTWCLWEAYLELPPGPAEIVVRAWDSATNTQPEDVKKVWNFKGYMNNAWHRVHIFVSSRGPKAKFSIKKKKRKVDPK